MGTKPSWNLTPLWFPIHCKCDLWSLPLCHLTRCEAFSTCARSMWDTSTLEAWNHRETVYHSSFFCSNVTNTENISIISDFQFQYHFSSDIKLFHVQHTEQNPFIIESGQLKMVWMLHKHRSFPIRVSISWKRLKKPKPKQDKKTTSTLNEIQKLKQRLNLIIHFEQWATSLRMH